MAALAEDSASSRAAFERPPRVIGGRYGLSSKEYNPGMAKAVFDELEAAEPKRHFTVGITDDVTHLSLAPNTEFRYRRPAGEVQAMFFGTGRTAPSAPTRTPSRSSARAPTCTPRGTSSTTPRRPARSPSRTCASDPNPIRSSYLIERADFVACHQFALLGKLMVLGHVREGGTFLLNSPYPADRVWDELPG